MSSDKQDFRPITFQGFTFPPTLMAASILESVLGIEDDELAGWLMRLTTCRGFTKRAPSDVCGRCARQLLDLMLEHRQRVLDGIHYCLAPHGFHVENTYRDWIMALQEIIKLSAAANGDCTWSAPLHPEDTVTSKADVEKFLRNLDNNKNIE